MEEKEKFRLTVLRTAPRSERASVVESALETIQQLRRKSEVSATTQTTPDAPRCMPNALRRRSNMHNPDAPPTHPKRRLLEI